MAGRQPKKTPGQLRFNEFFGKWAVELRKHEGKERRVGSGLSAAVIANRLLNPHKEHAPVPRVVVLQEFSPEWWEEVGEWWPFKMLRAAAAEDDREGCKRLLLYFLGHLRINPPLGVIHELRLPPGRPHEDKTAAVIAEWTVMGKPSLDWRVLDQIAKAHYPDEFRQSRPDPKRRKNLRDRIRVRILDHQSLATKVPDVK